MDDFFELILFTGACAICFAIGLVCGLSNNWDTDDYIIIKEVSLKEKHYEYETTKFDFVSDSLYNVGDTLVIRKL